ncbi:TPA: hypothetical protein QHN23_002862 [Klebsiella pneumoniae subsp. pneumoniae]|uniref:hypothetical protein n=1 Tax=Klebsiella pneumoniae TaxID=573 RepID=UPI0027ED41DB|nr:hypothetical protein [Klebsiella pneumoniae]MEB6281412.1 hypothetical protein [Klebsiella pneumoniae]HDT2868304.1 hypothetical protein [Klebsiella pneumoniae subsp. pneumoniae]
MEITLLTKIAAAVSITSIITGFTKLPDILPVGAIRVGCQPTISTAGIGVAVFRRKTETLPG